jgi:hypothetical protein
MYRPEYYQKNREKIKEKNLTRYHENKTTTRPVGRPRKEYVFEVHRENNIDHRKKYPFVPHIENNISNNINGLLEMLDSNETARPVRNVLQDVQSVFLPMQTMQTGDQKTTD